MAEKDKDYFCERADAFVREFFHIYLEQRDFDEVLRRMDSEITWFGTGEHEICRSYEQAEQLMEGERKSWGGRFRILECWTQAVRQGEDFCNVFGEMNIVEDGTNSILLEMRSRFSMICRQKDGRFLLHHAHYSVPNAAQSEDEFVHGNIVQNYNLMLEDRLRERTAQLEEKTRELESMANNILGGLQICSGDEAFIIRYVSDGFLKLLGYTREELLGTSHMALVHAADLALLQGQIARQLVNGTEFSAVYRVVRKDGEVRWVLDNGSMQTGADGVAQMQCFLTDITAQKQQEEELRVSQKRSEIALQQFDVSMFEYNIATKQLFLHESEASLYGMGMVIEDGPRVLAESGFYDPECVPAYLEMYRKICSGEETAASCLITAYDLDKKMHEFELCLTAVLDEAGVPIRAIGVKKNASHLHRLQREQEFGRALTGGRSFICEADLTNGRLLRIDPHWDSEIGMTPNDSYDCFIKRFTARCVEAGQQDNLRARLDAECLSAALERGEHLVQFSFRNTSPARGVMAWYEVTINIIRDETGGNVCARIYHEDISERKCKELQAEEERRLYETMLGKAMVAYEVNISRDFVVRGHEHWGNQHGIHITTCYSEMLSAFTRKVTDPHDGVRLQSTMHRQHVLRVYYSGEREVSCQYRKQESGKMIWVECTMHLFEDPNNGDVRGYAYVENIDKQKRAELTLRYKAEHDAHTDLYNKETTAELIAKYLQSPEDKRGTHALLMIDIDYFKSINDCFGHAFGDRVIAETGARIRALFRDDDVVGRVGGDEFCVFMKNVASTASVMERAERLCKALVQSYGEGEKVRTISASVGVALYPVQGRNFEELYRHADAALYEAKRNGRNRYAMAQ